MIRLAQIIYSPDVVEYRLVKGKKKKAEAKIRKRFGLQNRPKVKVIILKTL